MSFEKFNRKGRHALGGDNISLRKARINFSRNKPPFEHLVIEYDTENSAIRFSKGDKYDCKVLFQNGYFINCRGFSNKGLLPLGVYEKVGDMTYKLKKNTN